MGRKDLLDILTKQQMNKKAWLNLGTFYDR